MKLNEVTGVGKLTTMGISALLAALSLAVQVSAQEEMSIEQIRRELHEAAAKAASQKIDQPSAPAAGNSNGDFAFGNKDESTSNEKLVAAEAELLKKLGSQADSAQSGSAPAATQQDQANVQPPADSQESNGLTEKTIAIDVTAGKKGSVVAVNENAQAMVAPEKTAAVELEPKASLNVETKKLSSDESLQKNTSDKDIKVDSILSRMQKGKDAREVVLKEQIQEIASLRRANSDLVGKLQRSEASAASLKKQLADSNNRLMLAETEVERLSNVLETRNRATATRVGAPAGTTTTQAPVAAVSARSLAKRPSDDMPIITVVADKANLRTGPGSENSPLMAVSKGTRLVVEKREGEWYRVITPSGTRAWVSAEVVAFGPDAISGPSSTIRIKGYDPTFDNMPGSGTAAIK